MTVTLVQIPNDVTVKDRDCTFLLFRRPSNLSTAAAAAMVLMPPSPPTAAFPADRRLSVFAPEAQIRLNRGAPPIPQGTTEITQGASICDIHKLLGYFA